MNIFRVHQVTIKPRTVSTGKAGGTSYDYSQNNRTDYCRIVEKTADLAIKYARYSFNWTSVIYFDHDPQLVAEDGQYSENYQIVYKSRTFTVRGVKNAQELNRFWLVFCSEGD